jgi:hypothetical protein
VFYKRGELRFNAAHQRVGKDHEAVGLGLGGTVAHRDHHHDAFDELRMLEDVVDLFHAWVIRQELRDILFQFQAQGACAEQGNSACEDQPEHRTARLEKPVKR